MSNVAIVGIGIHPFGRHDLTGMEQGAVAVRSALADAGAQWSDVQYAFGGSSAAGNADTMVSTLGLTGLPFINVSNGCATGGSALISAYNAINAGAADVVMAIGFDKHPRGAFSPTPADFGLGDWYGDTGLMLTTQFFGMKIQRYMHEHGITKSTLAKVAVKNFDNGSKNENAWRRTPMSEDEVLEARMISDPLTQYMFCSPAEGGIALGPGQRRHRQAVHRQAGVPAFGSAAQPSVRQLRGVQPVALAGSRQQPDGCCGGRCVQDGWCLSERDRRGPDPGHRERRRGDAHGRDRAVRRR